MKANSCVAEAKEKGSSKNVVGGKEKRLLLLFYTKFMSKHTFSF